MANLHRPQVWLVDDREENRTNFLQRHEGEFNVRLYDRPDQLLSAIRTERPPDALLCDIYFYDDSSKREEVEKLIREQDERLRQSAEEIGAYQAQDGIVLIERVRDHYGGKPPFPIYAYTSKGPYLLQTPGFDRLEELGARWLLRTGIHLRPNAEKS